MHSLVCVLRSAAALTSLARQIRKCMTQLYIRRKHLLGSKTQEKRNTTGMPPGVFFFFHSFILISTGEALIISLGGEEALLVLFVQTSQTSYLK